MATTRQATKRQSKPEPKKEEARWLNARPPRWYGLVGNLTHDPELRFTPNGHAVASLRVAVSERVFNEESSEWEDTEPEFYTVTVWRQQGENAVESLHKGDRIVAIGQWESREWRTKDEDELVAVWELTARELGPSLLFRTVEINQPASRGKSTVVDPWEDGDEPPF